MNGRRSLTDEDAIFHALCFPCPCERECIKCKHKEMLICGGGGINGDNKRRQQQRQQRQQQQRQRHIAHTSRLDGMVVSRRFG